MTNGQIYEINGHCFNITDPELILDIL
jgi:hypothetical protein